MASADAGAAALPTTPEDVRALVAATPCVRLVGAGTKMQTPVPTGALTVSLRSLCGMLDYNPGEFTFTALAGTPVREVQALLARHGQMLPFDPPFVDRGATLGGTVASGLSGSGRYRNGGVRDFILGVRFVDGHGRLVRGGGHVVKNAA
ncbi:MAG: FAD-binding protein, partial [Vicinamibacterales bacterium]